jgi:hypothetical protein
MLRFWVLAEIVLLAGDGPKHLGRQGCGFPNDVKILVGVG